MKYLLLSPIVLLLLTGCMFEKQYVLTLGLPSGEVLFRHEQNTDKTTLYKNKEDCEKVRLKDENMFSRQGLVPGQDFSLLCVEYDKVKDKMDPSIRPDEK